jgi:SAM-dependent methyltransferase
MLNKLVNFPIWKNDGKEVVPLIEFQKEVIKNFNLKIKERKYKLVNNPCLCGNSNKGLDIVITEKDRHGIPCENLLCKKCGLIRLRERLDDYSTAEFYKNEYRDIYVGKETASEEFFDSQVQRGQIFLNLVSKYLDIQTVENVFEIGCGAGGILYPFNKIGKEVSGCDFGEKYLKFGKAKGLDLYEGEIDLIKTPKESQDLIILSHVMEHFTDPIVKILQIVEHIKPDKYLLVEVPGIFDIPKTYVNPILYFQNAHVHNYYYYYLKVFFEKLGLEVIYGNERCTFLLKKPTNWVNKEINIIFENKLSDYASIIEHELKKYYLQHILKLNPYYYKNILIRFLELLGLKEPIKFLLGKK